MITVCMCLSNNLYCARLSVFVIINLDLTVMTKNTFISNGLVFTERSASTRIKLHVYTLTQRYTDTLT